MSRATEADKPTTEDKQATRLRFWQTYISLGGNSVEWFENYVPPLLAIAARVETPAPQPDQSPKIPKDDFAPKLFVNRFDYKLLGWSRPVEPPM